MRVPALALLGCLVLSACGGSSDGGSGGSSPRPSGSSEAPSSAVPDIGLPPGPLRELVPQTADLPPGMVPIVAGTGPRDVKAVAGYSADPAKAQAQLTQHGFRNAYVAQYADPATGRVLSVVVTRFATPAGATADLAGDLASSGGAKVAAPTVGEQSDVRRQPLPQSGATGGSSASGELVTARFRKGATTWLVAYGATPKADPQVAVALARTLVTRA